MEHTDMAPKLRTCADNEGLGYWGNDKVRIGCVNEVNGPDSAEVPDFAPTRHELIQLVKYWATVALGLQFDYFLYSSTGSTEWRLGAFASRRINRIAIPLGEVEVQKAIREAEDKFSKATDPKAWAIFKNGTPAEQESFQDEVQRTISEDRS